MKLGKKPSHGVTLGTLHAYREMHCKAAWDVGKRRATAKIEMRMYVLEAMNGPLDGKRWEFDKNIIIGRDASAAAAALPVDHAVSRIHARIDVERSRLSIVDLGSSNGTILGGEPISSAANLDIGSPFIVGRTMLRVLRGGAAHPDNDSAH